MTERLLRRPAVEEMTGLSRSSIYAMMAGGDFPPPIRIGRRAVAWKMSAVTAWIEGRSGASTAL